MVISYFFKRWPSTILHLLCVDWPPINSIGPIAKLKGPYFQPSLSVCLSVCLWPALLPFIVDRFWWNLVTKTLLWSSFAASIMVQIGATPFWKFQKILKNHHSTFKILVHHLLCLCLLCIVKNSTRVEQNWRRRYIYIYIYIYIEVFHSGNLPPIVACSGSRRQMCGSTNVASASFLGSELGAFGTRGAIGP